MLHVSLAVRPVEFFVKRVLANVKTPQSAAGSRVPPIGNERRVVLGLEFHGDLEFWRWFANAGFEAIGVCLSAPVYDLVSRPARHPMFFRRLQACCIGGDCLGTSVYWRYNLTEDEQARSRGSSLAVTGANGISFDILE